MVPVQPIVSLDIRGGRFFSYVLPPGWRVGEEGPFAISLGAADNLAFTAMVGNAGLPVNYPPGRYVYDTLSALRPENLQMGPPRQVPALAGFPFAVQFDVAYWTRGVAMRGSVKCHILPAYDTALMVVTAAISDARQWPNYADWLPLVPEQISAINGAAFGVRGVMQQNITSSVAYGVAVREYNQWSQRNWAEVTAQREGSVARRAEEVRENLGGVQSYVNPFGSSAPVQLPTTYKYYWTDNNGNYLGSNDPSANPNFGATGEWRQMPPTSQTR